MTPADAMRQALSPQDFRQLWTSNCPTVLPATLQDFRIGGVLPAVLYMMRWGRRRGKGRFIEVFAPDTRSKKVRIADVAGKLAGRTDWFEGFDGEAEQAILGDLLLACCLENQKHLPGREEPVQRVYLTHYLSSRVDLPSRATDLRGVPEWITALLMSGSTGRKGGFFAQADGFERNLLLRLFGPGMSVEGQPDNLCSDRFDEATPVGIDQLLAIRVGLFLEEAPQAVAQGTGSTPTDCLAARAGRRFYEDTNLFLRTYGQVIPRQALLPMLESCLGIGLTNLFLSTVRLLLLWAEKSQIAPEDERPWPLFVDCSAGMDRQLRALSEESVDDCLRRLARFAIVLRCIGVLDCYARQQPPAPLERVNFLGALLHGDTKEAWKLEALLEDKCEKLAATLEADPDTSSEEQALEALRRTDRHPAWRLAEAIVALMRDNAHIGEHRKFLDSCLMMDEPNGMGRKRTSRAGGRRTERRSVMLSNSALDFLVHRHLCREGGGRVRVRPISLRSFLQSLRDTYGLYIDEAPPGLAVPAGCLQANRAHLERRLRDLGVLTGVNDAEAMKRLHSRFAVEEAHVAEGEENESDH